MSTPAGAGPSDTTKDAKDDRRKSLGKYVKRMSSVFRREKPDKVAPAASTPAEPAKEEKKEEVATVYVPHWAYSTFHT
jgi:hypothetical protein